MIPFRNPKPQAAREVLEFDFSARLAAGETLTGVASVAFAVRAGADASPELLANGAASVAGATVLVPVKDGVAGVDYAITVVATTSNAAKRPGLTGLLQVR